MNRKGLLYGVSAYVLWGVLPLFWHLLVDVDPLVILCCRLIFSTVFAFLLLAVMGRIGAMAEVMRSRRNLLRLLLSGMVMTANWGIYIWAVNRGHVLDASLGYYINPLMNFALGVLLFHDTYTKLDLVALGLALAGVLISTVSYGAFPWVAMTVAGTFAIYGALKKNMHLDAAVGLFVEALLMAPFAVLFLLFSKTGQAAIGALTLRQGLLLAACGPATAIPMILFAQGVNELPLSTMGFLQFVNPTMVLLIGVLFMGERFTPDKTLAFIFILAALAVYTGGMLLRERRSRSGAAASEGKDA